VSRERELRRSATMDEMDNMDEMDTMDGMDNATRPGERTLFYFFPLF